MTPTVLHAYLLDAFERWIASAPARGRRPTGWLADESANVYRTMWSAFVAFCVPLDNAGSRFTRIDPLLGLSTADLEAFLSTTGPGAEVRGHVRGDVLALRYAWRMLHLIDRVLGFARPQGPRSGPTAAAALLMLPPYRDANAASRDPPVEILSDGEARRLIELLNSPLAEAGLHPAARSDWKLLRDRALVAVMLGGGLAPGDAQHMRLDGVAFESPDDGATTGRPWRLTVPADGLSPEHQTPLARWAGDALARWLVVRGERGIPGQVLFPSTLAGKQAGRPALHGAVVGVLQTAGIPGGTPFRLRHSFAVRQLARGHSEDEVSAWLGLVESAAIQRYRQFVLKAPDLA